MNNEKEMLEEFALDFISQFMNEETFFVVPSRVLWSMFDKIMKGDVSDEKD